MKRLIASMAVALLLAATAFAQVPVIDGPEQIAPYKLIDLKVTGDWESAIWEVEPEGVADTRFSADGKTLTFVAPPGSYTVRAVLVNFTAKKIAQAKKAVTIGGAVPPDPPVPPTPIPGGKLDLVLVEETARRTPALAALVTSKELRDYLTKNGHRWYAVDPNPPKNVPPGLAPYVQLVAPRFDKGLATLVIVDQQSGAILYQGDPPAAKDAVALVKSKGG